MCVYWQWLQAGYYLPDTELVRENYKVQLPALHDLERFGVYISYDCRFYDTYQLVRDDDYMRGLISSLSVRDMQNLAWLLKPHVMMENLRVIKEL